MNSSEIEEAAKGVFHTEKSPRLITSEEVPDKQHLDYTGHVQADGKPRGLQFAVQLKGAENPSYSADSLSYDVKLEHLRYWIDESSLPVFLVLVDVTTKRAYWRSILEWDSTTKGKWRKNTVTRRLHVPTSNRVSDGTSLVAAIEAAHEELRERRPGSVAAAAAHELAKLEGVDGRFRYDVGFRNGTTQITLNARERVDTKLQVVGDAAIERFRQVLATGERQAFTAGELTFLGEGIFERWRTTPGTIELEIFDEKNIDLAISVDEGKAGSRKRAIAGFRGLLRGGSARKSFRCYIPDFPLEISGNLSVVGSPPSFNAVFNFEKSYRGWLKRPVLSLPNLDRFESLAEALSQDSTAFIEIAIDGLDVFVHAIPDACRGELLETAQGFVELAARLRKVAERLGVNPPLPLLSELTDVELGALDDVCALCEHGRIEEERPPHRFEQTLSALPNPLPSLRERKFLLQNTTVPALFGEESPTSLVVHQQGEYTVASDWDPGELGGPIVLPLATTGAAVRVHVLVDRSDYPELTCHDLTLLVGRPPTDEL